MFDLITGTQERTLRKKTVGPKVISMVVHVAVATLVIVIPLLRVTDSLPEMPTMMAFVASMPDAPPPRRLHRLRPPRRKPWANPRFTRSPRQPMRWPRRSLNRRTSNPKWRTSRQRALWAVSKAVWRVAWLGGIVGGLVGMVAPPPPPPPAPAPAPRGPVRIGGQLTAPALLKRVEPIYPEMASAAQLTGLVILEATVGTDGCVEGVKVLRSRHPFLDKASVDALKQWQYSPLVLNGIPTPFVLTVTFNFSVSR